MKRHQQHATNTTPPSADVERFLNTLARVTRRIVDTAQQKERKP